LISLDRLNTIADWARQLPPDELERARRGIVEKRFARGTFVCHRGDRFDYWAGVITGLLRLGSVSSAGKEVTFAGLPPRGWFGEGSMLKNEARRYDVTALRGSKIALMDRATFLWLFEHSVGFNRFLVRQFNERLGQFMAMIEQERMLDSTGRVARAIAALLNPTFYPDAGLHVSISQEEVGALAGLSRQSANSALRLLEEAGLIRSEKGGYAVSNLEKLARFGE